MVIFKINYVFWFCNTLDYSFILLRLTTQFSKLMGLFNQSNIFQLNQLQEGRHVREKIFQLIYILESYPRDESSMQRIVHATNCPCDELSVRRIVRAPYPRSCYTCIQDYLVPKFSRSTNISVPCILLTRYCTRECFKIQLSIYYETAKKLKIYLSYTLEIHCKAKE